MDEETRALLQRYNHRITNADDLYRQAESKREQADDLQKALDHPQPYAPSLDESLTSKEIADLRQQAIELDQRAAEIQRGLAAPPTQEMIREVDTYFDRMANPGRDRDRGR